MNLINYLEVDSGIRSLLFSLPLTAVTLFAGSLFVKDKSGYQGVFFSLLWGTLISTIFFAIWMTNLKSIFLLACPSLVLIYYFSNKASVKPQRLRLSILPALLLLSVLFSLKAWYTYSWQQLIPDHAFYARISAFIASTGQENEYHQLNNLNSVYHGLSPYHYFELWFNGMVNTYSGRLSLLNYLTVTTIHFNLLLVLALASLVERISKIKYTLLFCLLIIQSSSINIFEWLNKTALKDFGYIYYSISAYNELKFAIPIVLIAAFLLLIKDKENTAAYLWLSLLPVLNFTLIPALTMAFTGFSLFVLVLQKNNEERKTILLSWFWFILTVASIFILYQSSWSTGVARDAVKISDTIRTVITNSANVMQVAKIALAGIISVPVCLALWVLPLFFLKNHRDILQNNYIRIVFLFTGLLFAGGAISWGLLNETLNSVQLFSILTRAYILLIAVMLPFYLTNKKTQSILFLLLITGTVITIHQIQKIKTITINNSPEQEFIQAIASEMALSSVQIGFIRAESEYSNPFNCYPHFSIPAAGIMALNDTMMPISLSEFACKNCRENPACRNGLVLGLVQQELVMDNKITVSGFCKKYNIGLILSTKEAHLPKGILADTIKSDPISGLQLLKIKSFNEYSE